MMVWSKDAFRNAIFISLLLIANGRGFAQVNIYPSETGLMDATAWDFANDRFALSGCWTFFENKLLDPTTIASEKGAYIYFPKLLNDIHPSGSGVGFATYNLQVLVPDSLKRLALEIPQLYNSYKLWVNGKLLTSTGKVGATAEAAIPQWHLKNIAFNVLSDTLDIVLQISNFHHYKGGSLETIYLGLPEHIDSHWSWAYGINITEIFFLLLEGAVFIFLYLKQKNKHVILYMACICLTWAVRSAFSNLYPINLIAHDFNWNALIRIEYITLFGGVIWSMLFINSLFKNISNQIFTYLLVGINVFFILFTLTTQPIVFTRWISVYLTIAGIAVFYGVVIVIKALLHDQAGAWFLMVSILCGAIIFAYDIVSYGSVGGYNLIFLHVGYMIIFLLVAIALLLHLNIIKNKPSHNDVLSYKDFFQKEIEAVGKD